MFSTRFIQKINFVKKNDSTTKHIQHILETIHVREIVENTTSLLRTTNVHKNTTEKFHIYNLTEKKQLTNDNNSIIKNPNFQCDNDIEINKTDSEITYVSLTFKSQQVT